LSVSRFNSFEVTREKKERGGESRFSFILTSKGERLMMVQSDVSHKLAFKDLADEADRYNELVKITIENKGYTEVYKHFSPRRIELMLNDFSGFINHHQAETENELDESELLNVLLMYILAYFTTLVETMPENYEEKARLFEIMLGSEITEKAAEAMDPLEVQKIMKRLMKKMELVQAMVKKNEETREQFKQYVEASPFKNKELLLQSMFQDSN
jgi:hypothetical protein